MSKGMGAFLYFAAMALDLALAIVGARVREIPALCVNCAGRRRPGGPGWLGLALSKATAATPSPRYTRTHFKLPVRIY